MDVSCAILAGGKSSRMGKDKATLMVGDKALINQVYDKARLVFDEILVVSNHHERLPGIEAPIIRDILPIRSSIVGIASALLYARTPYVFVLACDMPFITEQSIWRVLGDVHGEDIIIPRTKNGYEPLHAVYNRSCLSIMLTLIGRQRLKVRDLFPFLFVKEVWGNNTFMNREVSVFTNINVEEDLSLVERLGNG
jgi:molybdopterin-guanine dinucleotide biosynthesis protein A